MNLKFFYSILFFILTIIIIVIYFEFNLKSKQLKENITNIEVELVSEYAQNISDLLMNHTKFNLYLTLKKNIKLRKELEKSISMLKGSKYINIFVVRYDNQDKFRYLLDSEKIQENKGEFNQKFDPQNEIWNELILTKKPQYAIQKNIKDLWITYLHPVIKKDNIIAVIAFDFSIKTYIETSHILSPFEQFLFYLIILIGIILIFNFIQMYIQYKYNLKTYIDPLTSVYNRHYLNKIIKDINLKNYVICIIDVDFFKKINDNYGHQAGDKVLQTFAKRIQNKLKKDDIIIRYGGEEFLLILKTKDYKVTNVVFERMRKAIEENPILVEDKLINITASFGVNLQPKLNKSLLEAIKEADIQLYKAKNTGRNRIEYINK